jgi:hypothetical protein
MPTCWPARSSPTSPGAEPLGVTEANLVTTDPDLVRQTRLRLWAEHLQRPESEVDGEIGDVVDRLWRPIARGPGRTRIMLLPGVSRRAERLEGPLRGLLVDG